MLNKGGGGGTEGRMEGRMSGNSHLCSTGHQPFGAAAQKEPPLVIVAKALDGQRYPLPL